ncbi:thioredoxin-like protein [Cubamyces lactineus]|nr:thioredoxin-like protein [Cubamyces lactineus]
MKLSSLARLAASFSLLAPWAVLPGASTALPTKSSTTELLILTADNFESTIAEGVWFIEYMSPYCGHCRSFAPTWERLVEKNGEKADPGIYLAQVNCAAHGGTPAPLPLCVKNAVVGYPQMNLYRNGQFVETFKQARTIELLTEYLNTHAEPRVLPMPVTTSESAPTAVDLEADDSPIEHAKPSKDGGPIGAVVSLDEQTFKEATDEGGVFVNFFLPWGYQSRKLAPTWTQLAHEVNGRVAIAEVNCQEHSALCSHEGVIGCPMMFYYGGKGRKTQYRGDRSLAHLQAFAEVNQDAVDLMNHHRRPAPSEVGVDSSQEVMNAL